MYLGWYIYIIYNLNNIIIIALYVMLLVHCKKNIVVMLSVLKFIPDRRSSNKAWEDLYNWAWEDLHADFF